MSASRNIRAYQDIRDHPSLPSSVKSSFINDEGKDYHEVFDVEQAYTGNTWKPLDLESSLIIKKPLEAEYFASRRLAQRFSRVHA